MVKLQTEGIVVAGVLHRFSVVWLAADLMARAAMLNFRAVRSAVSAYTFFLQHCNISTLGALRLLDTL